MSGQPDVSHLVGKNVDDVDLSQYPSRRVLPPNSMVTMDFRPDRLNVHIDENRVIVSLNWG
jgi:hypothetical protein